MPRHTGISAPRQVRPWLRWTNVIAIMNYIVAARDSACLQENEKPGVIYIYITLRIPTKPWGCNGKCFRYFWGAYISSEIIKSLCVCVCACSLYDTLMVSTSAMFLLSWMWLHLTQPACFEWLQSIGLFKHSYSSDSEFLSRNF